MTKNFIQPGGTITLNAPADVVSGQGVLAGKFFGVCAYSAAINTPVEVTLEGVFELPKVAGAVTQGQLLYWTGTALTTFASGNILVGAATEAAVSDDPTVRVRLNGVSTQ